LNCPSCQAENEAAAIACADCGAELAPTAITGGTSTAAGEPATAPSIPAESFVVTVDLRPGALFHSRYEILGPLGKGGMGMVFKARDRSLDETVAIKILRPEFAQDAKMTERFRSEIKLARRVRHRNVCTIHDYGEDHGLLYISMEFVEGVDLKQILRSSGALPADTAFDVAVQVAEGLQAVHDAGIVHRDLKTPNIMLDSQGVARLMDFGVAKRLGDLTLTATGHIVGTPEYMSPEQAQGKRADFRTDLYALGVVTYEIFTGHVPFRGDTPLSTILKHLNEAPPLEGAPAAGLPAALRPVLRRALAKDPERRHASAREMAEALRQVREPSRRQAAAAADAPREPAPATPARPRPSRRRSPRITRSLQAWLLVVPLLAVGGGVVLVHTRMWSGAPHPGASVAVNEPRPAATAPASIAAPAPPPPTVAAPPPATVLAPPPTVAETRAATAPARSHGTPRAAPPPVVHATPTPTLASAPPAPEAIGYLQVVVKPWGTVWLDGRAVGETPLGRLDVPAGAHKLRVRNPAYEIWEGSVTIRPGQTERILVDFPQSGVKKQD
jgi:predicted Ser/Thr protein kinase